MAGVAGAFELEAQPAQPPCVRIGSGARALEADLLDALERDLAELRGPPLDLARPVRVVVPSASLREHVVGALLRRSGRALVGLRVQTLAGLAREILDRAGEPAAAVDGLLALLAARAARGEPALVRALGGLRAGFELVAESVADLLDAGLGPEHAEALEELLAADPAAERARAVLRVALAVSAEHARLRRPREGDLLARAAALLEERGAAALPARVVRVHGFADATGRAADLLVALLRALPTEVWLDVPGDPWSADPGALPQGAYVARLRERLAGAARERPASARAAPAELALRCAPGPEEEVRAVARDVRRLLDAGVPPERIALVARDLEPWVVPIRTHFGRLGIPFSGVGRRGPAAAGARQLGGLLELLREPAAVPVARWLELLRPAAELGSLERSERADAALACHVLGAGRLGELAALDLAAELAGAAALRLPVRRGVEEPGGRSEEPTGRLVQRRVARDRLAALQRRAQQWLGWSERARAGQRAAAEHGAALLDAVTAALGWGGDEEPAQELRAALASVERDVPVELDAAEFAALLARALDAALREPLGGAGAGVAVLDVMEARARCFDQLFVIGLTRDAFPRALREDPLLPDALRARIAWLLPDLPIRSRSRDEERHLFAQLLSASPRVLLSYAERSRGGELELPSSFVERFELAQQPLPLEIAPALSAPGPALGPRTAHEHAVLGGLRGGLDALPRRLELALAEGGGPLRASAAAVERARIAVLRELEERDAPLGPYFGFVGPLGSPRDPRRAPLYVTALESLARCPWQAFLGRVLRIEPPVDALADLPALEPQRIGKIVHRAFEGIAERLGAALGRPLAELLPQAGVPLRWPGPAELESILEQAAHAILREEGIRLPGLARALAESLLPRLAAVPALLGECCVLGAEVEGSLAPGAASGAERARPLFFRADWVIRGAQGVRLLDFKTGRCFATSPQNRDAQRTAAVQSGRYLQALLYGLAAGADAVGAYLFLDPELEPGLAYLALPHGDPQLRAAFDSSAALLGAAHAQGVFVPRLQERGADGDPTACRFCEVSQACLQGDLAARARFARALEDDAEEPAALQALLALPEPP